MVHVQLLKQGTFYVCQNCLLIYDNFNSAEDCEYKHKLH